MNKAAIKNFAVEARKMLIKSAVSEAGLYGITKDRCAKPVQTGNGFEVYKTIAGTDNRIFGDTIKKRASLVKAIEDKGFDNVIEETAYTWFNRLIAIRFMEVNDYLPTRVRVLSSETSDKKEPDIVTQALDVDLNMSEEELAEVQKAKDENRYDDAFGLLFIKQCNELNAILPGLFEKTDDYMELLLKLSYTNDGIVRMLVDTVPEEDFDVEKEGQVEIIGWMYQYYNTELKDETFALLKKNVKITKERIPAATQLFTPDWIVRYMVENSLGRLWIEHLRANDSSVDEKSTAEELGWKYYLPEAKQEDSVNVKLAEIRVSYKDMTPMDIKCIDPCMGSGHILVYMFDVLMDIYKSAGYSQRDTVFYILENNISGLDIDQRAYQLSYFALMMKGRSYNRRFFAGREVEREGHSWRKYPSPNVRAIKESNTLPDDLVNQIKENFADVFNDNELKCIQYVMDVFKDAKEYGSIINVDSYCNPEREDRQYASVALKLYSLINGDHEYFRNHDMNLMHHLMIQEYFPLVDDLMQQAHVMCEKYDVVITNPPYMGNSGMTEKLFSYVKKYYPNGKADMFAVFIEKCKSMIAEYGYFSMITQHAWMFLHSFEKLRDELRKLMLINMAHQGARAFEEISGEVVQTTAFTMKKYNLPIYEGKYCRLIDYESQQEKESAFLRDESTYISSQDNHTKIPNKVIAYWISDAFISAFAGKNMNDYGASCIGMRTGDNERFLRLWYEIVFKKIGIGFTNGKDAKDSGKKWFPYCKGGTFRKWYGNNDYVVNWENDGYEIKENTKRVYPQLGNNLGWKISNEKFYFKKGLTWSGVGSSIFGVRSYPEGMIFDSGANSFFVNNENDYFYFAGLLNTKLIDTAIKIINPTINTGCGVIAVLPAKYDASLKDEVNNIVEECISISKCDWDSYETSWDFVSHPFVKYASKVNTIQEAYELWKQETISRFNQLKRNEERLNEMFIGAYGLNDDIKSEVRYDDITVRIANEREDVLSFVSYAVGCMFGRYSIDKKGIAYGGGDWNKDNYKTFIPDEDNIIPINDVSYFNDDIVERFVQFVECVFGKDTLKINLNYIAKVLGNKGNNSKEIIRTYFINDFYKDHCSMYSITGSGKRPIYWLFDSGKQNAFKALIYMHRYDKDTVGRIRTDYLHKTQNAIEGALKNTEYIISSSTSTVDKAKATKDRDKYIKQLAETRVYDQALAYIAHKRIEIDLDDGVKHNYQLFQGVEISNEGTKKQKIDLLANI